MEKQDPPSAFGVFKPVGHVVVSFSSEADAQGALSALAEAGYKGQDVVHYTPEQMVSQADHDIADAGILASIGQELNLVKAHRELALQGATFLVVHAPKDDQITEVAGIVRRFHATRAQSYGRLLIEELTDVGETTKQVGESPDRGLDAQTVSGQEKT